MQYFFPMAPQPQVGQGLHIIKALRSHSDKPHSVRLPWTSDQPDAVTSTWPHTIFTRDRHAHRVIRIRNPSKREAEHHALDRATTGIQYHGCFTKYRVIKKSLCTWWLQYRKLQVMFKVSPASLQTFIDTRLTLTPSAIPNSNYVIIVSNCLKYFCVFLYCYHQVHRDVLITLYKSNTH
jgi:hypothetical protein